MRKRAWVFALVGPLPQALGYVAGPLALARAGRRRGWRDRRPGPANRIGLLPLLAGATVMAAAIRSHYRAAPEVASLSVVPSYLAQDGIYAITRNPMYLGGALMQLGWSILLGSLPVAGVGVTYVLGMDRLGIPFEERLLHERFGPAYDSYRARVPRWLPGLPGQARR